MTMNTNRFLLAAAGACAFLASTLSASPAQKPADANDVQLEVAREIYRPDTWAQGGLRAGLALGALELEGFQGAEPEGSHGLVLRRFGALQPEAGGFFVELTVSDDLAGAREQLLAWLSGVTSPERVPRADELGFSVGEIAFVGRSRYGAEHPLWIAFVRGNLAVRVQATDLRVEPRPKLVEAAKRIDAAIALVPLLAANESVPHPAIDALSAAKSSPKAGETVRIGVDAFDPKGGEPRLTWILGGPATGYVERGDDGAWYLHSTGPGAMELTVEAFGANGTFARRSIQLRIQPE